MPHMTEEKCNTLGIDLPDDATPLTIQQEVYEKH
jgi:hypothetical protein